MKKQICCLALPVLGMILLFPSTGRPAATITLELGPAPSYEYPFESSGEHAVRSDEREIAASAQLGLPLSSRWSVLTGAKYWTDNGPVILPRIPEERRQTVHAQILPIYTGVRFQPGPRGEPVALYLDLAAGITILRSSVRTHPNWFNNEASETAATDVAPTAIMAASISIRTWRFMSFVLTTSYLHSTDFPNDENLIIRREFGGLRQLAVMGGIDLRIR